MQGNWEGSRVDSFNGQFIALKPKISKFVELLNQINQQLVVSCGKKSWN
nr:hypothetical protein [Enterococcus sp. 5H]